MKFWGRHVICLSCSIFVLLAFLCLPHVNGALFENGTTQNKGNGQPDSLMADLALAVFRRKLLTRAIILSCQTTADWRVYRRMTKEIPTSIVTPLTLWKLERAYVRQGILFAIDSCSLTEILLNEIQPYVNSSYHWLLVGEERTFDGLTLRFDSSVTLAVDEEESYRLVDVYSDPSERRNRAHIIGTFTKRPEILLTGWVDAENAPYRSRVNRTVNTGLLVQNLSNWGHPVPFWRLDLPRSHPQVGTTYFAMTDFNLYLAVAHLYNISMKISYFDKGGYLSKHGFFTHMTGALQSQKIEVAATKLLLYPDRIAAADFLNTCDPFSLGVIYYVGRSEDAPTALLEPFSTGLWLTVIAVVTLGAISLFYVGHYESSCEYSESDLSVSAAILVMVGGFTGQGHPFELKWPSTRLVLIVLIFTAFLIASAYSAVIIRSLLSAPNPNIRNRAEYMRSPLKMAVEDYFPFTALFFGVNMDQRAKELYERKVRSPVGPGYRQVEDAFQGMLSQQWAMFAQVNNIKLGMATSTPQQVCRIAWINDLGNDDMLCPIVKKRSDLKNLLSRGFPLVVERGLYNREKRKHHAGDVPCLPEHSRLWVPVKIELVISAIGVVFAGATIGTLLCVAECFHGLRIQYQRNQILATLSSSQSSSIRVSTKVEPPKESNSSNATMHKVLLPLY